MYEEILVKAGLSLREVKVYALLLKHGEIMASEISEKSGLIRTNTYDILSTLIKKGIVSYAIRNGKKYFRAAEPEKVLDYIENQQKDLEELKGEVNKILPNLKPAKDLPNRPSIEIYEGREGFKTILEMSVRETLRAKKEILAISVQQQKCRKLGGPYHIRWYKEREKLKLKSRYLMSAEENIIPVKYTQFKKLPPEAKNPNEIFIFGDVTTQFFFVGDLFSAIVIKSKEITDNYRNYFDFLWKFIK